MCENSKWRPCVKIIHSEAFLLLLPEITHSFLSISSVSLEVTYDVKMPSTENVSTKNIALLRNIKIFLKIFSVFFSSQ